MCFGKKLTYCGFLIYVLLYFTVFYFAFPKAVKWSTMKLQWRNAEMFRAEQSMTGLLGTLT